MLSTKSKQQENTGHKASWDEIDNQPHVRKPEPTTVIRIPAFNKIQVTQIYDNSVSVFET
jgi:hypothetical protein